MAPSVPATPQRDESDDGEGDAAKPETGDPDALKTDPNPLNPAGDSLDRLIQLRINDDAWSAMMGDLPCLEASEACIGQLQNLAIQNARTLKAIDERIEAVKSKIEEARKNNQKTIALGVFEPLVQSWLKLEDVPVRQGEQPRKRGVLDRVGNLLLGDKIGAINEILSLIGVPLFRKLTGGDSAAQQRTIAIADLQVKLAEIENKRGDLAAQIREQVIIQVLDFDQYRREFQVSQEVSRREVLRQKVREIDYRFAVGNQDTVSYLGSLSVLDQQKAQSFRAWAKLRAQLARVKLLVLGPEGD